MNSEIITASKPLFELYVYYLKALATAMKYVAIAKVAWHYMHISKTFFDVFPGAYLYSYILLQTIAYTYVV